MKVIESIYKNLNAKVQINGQGPDHFKLEKGIKQGNSLTSLLFRIAIDKLMKNNRR